MDRKMRCLMLAVLVLAGIAGTSAHAADNAITAFQDIVNTAQVSGPGYYTSATRGIFTGGSLRVYVPREHVSLVSFTPPHVAAGCGGISAYMGGLSWISLAQLKQMASTVMASITGYAINLALRTLCPMCSDILDQLEALAQKAAAMSKDSCQMAKSLVNSAASFVGLNPDNQGNSASCSDIAASDGKSSGFMSAITSMCQGVGKATGWIDSHIRTLTSSSNASDQQQGEAEASKTATQVGDTLWQTLTLSGYANTYVKEIILSMQGFTTNAIPKGAASGTQPELHFFSPWASQVGSSADDLMDILLFGADPSSTAAALESSGFTPDTAMLSQIQAAEKLNLGDLPFVLCEARDSSGNWVLPSAYTPPPGKTTEGASGSTSGNPSGISTLMMCNWADPDNTVKSVAASGKNPLITTNGLIASVYNTLTSAVDAVAAGKPIPQKAVQLMQATPLPLYQMVNVAAVYPFAASQMVSTYSSVVATLIAQRVVQSWISNPDTDGYGVPVSANVKGAMDLLGQVMNGITAAVKARVSVIGQALALQDGLLGSIKQINDVMYQSLASTGIQGNVLFTQGLAASQATGH